MKSHRRVTPEEVLLAVAAFDSIADEELIEEIHSLNENIEGLKQAKIVSLRTSNDIIQTRTLLERVIHYRRTGSAEG